MLFNSYGFIFVFLPITLLGFHLIGSQGLHRVALAWLVSMSLFFYGWWNPVYLGLILGSMLFNYAVGIALSARAKKAQNKQAKWILAGGIAGNLFLLGYYKYANFFVDNLNILLGNNLSLETIILPLAISFFTFQQIAYLVDAFHGDTHEYRFLHYALFVTFFPQLIAGPIVHHREMLPQFARSTLYRLKAENLAIGLTIFTIGLFKKGFMADGIAIYATPVFDAAEDGMTLTFFEAWVGTITYSLQLYFDFSGYSDMAIGLARMFGVRLPLNFNSPYKATSIIDFWRRWHITLSRFLRDYLYIPLGGSRKGEPRRMTNLLITMLLGGLWHGAGWTFVIWGGLHGIFLVVNHLWRKWRAARGYVEQTRSGLLCGWALTMLVVAIAWVPFRAESLSATENMLAAMAGFQGFAMPQSYLAHFNRAFDLGNFLASHGWQFTYVPFFPGASAIIGIAIMLAIAFAFPNTQQLTRRYRPAFETYKGEIQRLAWRWLEWRPTPLWALASGILFMISILTLNVQVSEFLYFQF